MTEKLDSPDQELFARLFPAYRKITVVGKTVFVPPIISSRRAPFMFPVKQLKLLYQLTQTENLEEACKLAEVGVASAKKFLKSPEYLEFAADAIMDQAIADGWTPKRIVVELDRIYRGEMKVGETQFDALKELRSIVIPKKMEAAGTSGVTVNLNFSALSPDLQAKLKVMADKEATIDTDATDAHAA